MTAFANDFAVATQQSIIRVSVVVEERLRPLRARMARVTLLAVVRVVGIVFNVTRNALHAQFIFKRPLRVTVAAVQ